MTGRAQSKFNRHRDGQIRAVGAIGLAGSLGCLAILFHDPTAMERMAGVWRGLLATAAYLGMSWGSLLLTLGVRIHDPIAVSRRLIYMAPRRTPADNRPAWHGRADREDQPAKRAA
jgi:hypothetical protein